MRSNKLIQPHCKSKKDMETLIGKWSCMACNHTCLCSTCQLANNENLDNTTKTSRKPFKKNTDDGSILEVDESIFVKAKPVTHYTEKYGVKIIKTGKKKTYVVGNKALNLEYISNHEYANVTRLRNLYLLPKSNEEAKKQLSNANEKKTEDTQKASRVEQESVNQAWHMGYNPYMNGMFSQVFPIGIVPYQSIDSIKVQPNLEEKLVQGNQSYYCQAMFQPYPCYGFGLNVNMNPAVYNQRENINLKFESHEAPLNDNE